MSVSIITLKSDMKNAKKKNVDKQEFLVDVQRHYCGVSFECEKQVYRVGTAYNFFGAKNILKGAMFNEPQYTYSVLSSFFFFGGLCKGGPLSRRPLPRVTCKCSNWTHIFQTLNNER